LLASFFIAEVADRFEADHRHDLLAALATAFRIDVAAHRLRLKVRRLFIRERDEAQRAARSLVREGSAHGTSSIES
jgi:hypothetical protein